MLGSSSDFLGRQVGSAPMAYFLHDAHGDVVGVVDGGGQFLAKYAYDAFGVLTGRSGSFDNPYLYAGEYYDYTTGQYYLRARFYTPSIGRFVTADTYRGEVQDPRTLHLYAYVLNNPLSYIDPTGHRPILIDIGGPASEETIAEILMDYEKKVAGEFSSYVAASDLGLSQEAVEAAAEQVFDDDEERKFARLRGQCVVGERELTAQFGDAGSRGFGCQLVMSYTYDASPDLVGSLLEGIGAIGFVELGVVGAKVVGGFVVLGAGAAKHIFRDAPGHAGHASQ